MSIIYLRNKYLLTDQRTELKIIFTYSYKNRIPSHLESRVYNLFFIVPDSGHFLDLFLYLPVLIFHVQKVILIFFHLMSLTDSYADL